MASLLNGSSFLWCMCNNSSLAGGILHCSQLKPRASISSCLSRIKIDDDGLKYGLPFLYLGFSGPLLNCMGAGLRFFAADIFLRLSAVQTLCLFISATWSALFLAFSRIFAMDSGEWVRPLCSCPLMYLFHRRLDAPHKTTLPQPQSQNGGGVEGSVLSGEGFPRLLCPCTNLRFDLTGNPQPQAHSFFDSLFLFMPNLYHEHELITS